MVTARVAVGSVTTLALGALLLGSAPYWLGRHTASQSTPWGSISPLSGGGVAAIAREEDRAQLLKLATSKAAPPVPVAAPTPEATPAADVSRHDPAASDATTQSSAAAVEAGPVPAAMDVAMVAPQQPAADQVVAGEATAVPETDAAASGRVNINTASADTLDHLPGTGRIGRAIVSHRPYKSVKDLVNRRVLRLSDYQKIQSRISVD